MYKRSHIDTFHHFKLSWKWPKLSLIRACITKITLLINCAHSFLCTLKLSNIRKSTRKLVESVNMPHGVDQVSVSCAPCVWWVSQTSASTWTCSSHPAPSVSPTWAPSSSLSHSVLPDSHIWWVALAGSTTVYIFSVLGRVLQWTKRRIMTEVMRNLACTESSR